MGTGSQRTPGRSRSHRLAEARRRPMRLRWRKRRPIRIRTRIRTRAPGRHGAAARGRAQTVGGLRLDVDGAEVWVRSPDAALTPSPEALVALFLLPASRAGRPLRVPGRLDPRFAAGLREVQRLAEAWWGLAPVAVADDAGPVAGHPARAPDPPPSPPEAGAAALCFTGGVDSFYSLLGAQESFRSLVFVRGFDLPRSLGAGVLDGAERRVRAVAERLGLAPLVVETNLREHPLVRKLSWEIVHGGALAGVGHLLAGSIGSLAISASYPASWKGARWGSHGRLDPLWSSSRLTLRHVGDELFREEKLRRIATDDVVREHLRVCWEAPTPDGNCGRCEKCLRTRLILARHHPHLRVQTLPPSHTLPDDLARLGALGPDLCRIYARLAERPMPAATARAIRDLIRRSGAARRELPA